MKYRQNQNCLCQISSGFCIPEIFEIGSSSTELFKNHGVHIFLFCELYFAYIPCAMQLYEIMERWRCVFLFAEVKHARAEEWKFNYENVIRYI